MIEIFKGQAWKYNDDVDTDVIIPARYLNTSDEKELAKHCMEDIDATFAKEVKDNFGTVWLLTNSDLPPNKVFETYKQRWDIETFYNQIKKEKNIELEDENGEAIALQPAEENE